MKARAKQLISNTREYAVKIQVEIVIEQCRTPDDAIAAAMGTLRDLLQHLEFALTAMPDKPKILDPRRLPH